MIRRLLILIAVLLPSVCVKADLKPQSLAPNGDLIYGNLIRKDLNNIDAAVVRVKLPVQGVKFDGDLIGEPTFDVNEYIVWLEAGCRMMEIKCPGENTLRIYFEDFGIPSLESRTGYDLTFARPSVKLSTVPRHLSLAVERDGTRYFATTDDWAKVSDKDSYNIIGIAIIQSGERFILAWEDEYDKLGAYKCFNKVYPLYGDNIPTKAQADILVACSSLRNVAQKFGSDNYGNFYWTRTECPPSWGECNYVFCPGIPTEINCADREGEDNSSNTGVVLVYPL